MKEWQFKVFNHHDDVGKTIAEMEGAGWQLHTYTLQDRRSMELYR